MEFLVTVKDKVNLDRDIVLDIDPGQSVRDLVAIRHLQPFKKILNQLNKAALMMLPF